MSTALNLIHTSVDDCASSLKDRDPIWTIRIVTEALEHMNANGIDHKSRRQVMVREAKRAITALGNGHEKQTL